MQIYKVGGAVRDRLLGQPVKDIDWLVVGATVEQMLAQGFRPVGDDFPVFLHPQTGEEYALARTERKSGQGYGGFTFFARVVQAKLGITAMRSNELEIIGGKLTGRVLMQSWGGDVVDAAEKRRALEQFAAEHGATLAQCIAVGDGANDLPMMGAAGLSVAYHAKPAVRAQAMVAINTGGLDRLLEVFAD